MGRGGGGYMGSHDVWIRVMDFGESDIFRRSHREIQMRLSKTLIILCLELWYHSILSLRDLFLLFCHAIHFDIFDEWGM